MLLDTGKTIFWMLPYGYITKSLKTIPAKELGSDGEVNAVVLQQYV
jgi:hypothetical protein